MIYLDYQSTTPLAPEALDAMLPWLSAVGSSNPHATHAGGRAAKAAVEAARDAVDALMPRGGAVYFTSGATEALNWALQGANARRIGVAAIEHAAVLDTASWLSRRSHDVVSLPVDRTGLLRDTVPFADLDLVAIMHVNNEIGTVQPITRVADQARAAGALMLCDAVQSFGKLTMPDGCDLIAVSAHKLHGPKGIGALWVRDGIKLDSLMHGGGQEGGLRSGTLSPALCAGFGSAASLAAARMADDAAHADALWSQATSRLTPDWTINGSKSERWRGNLNIRRPGLDAARLISELRDIAFSSGSACASGSGRPSHVLRAIGLTDAEARSSIRLGWGRYTTAAELTDAIERIVETADTQLELSA